MNLFKFIVLKYSQIYYKYFKFNKFTELRYYSIENFETVSKKYNNIAVLLNFGILHSPISYSKVLLYMYIQLVQCLHWLIKSSIMEMTGLMVTSRVT